MPSDPPVVHVLAVVDATLDRVAVVRLPGEPEDFGDLVRVASVVAVEGADVTPAGPPLLGPQVAVHRVRAGLPAEPAVAPDVPGAAAALGHRALDEETGRLPVPPEREGWARPGWAQETRAWVDAVLGVRGWRRTGPEVVVRSWPLSHVERVPIEGVRGRETLYLKAASRHFASEPVVTAFLAARFPGDVPDVVAVDAGRATMLMRALPGQTAQPGAEDEPVDPAVVAGAAAVIARMQVACLDDLPALRAAGAPDRSPARTRADAERVATEGLELGRLDATDRARLRDVMPWALDQVEALAACGVPSTLVHGDLHPGNVSGGPSGSGRVVLFDWTDACVAHPFLDAVHLRGSGLSVTEPLDPETPWLRAYLAPWRQGWSDSVLLPALRLAPVVERLFQAVTYEGLQRSLEPAARAPLDGVQARILRSLGALAAAQGV